MIPMKTLTQNWINLKVTRIEANHQFRKLEEVAEEFKIRQVMTNKTMKEEKQKILTQTKIMTIMN